ncbi:TPA: Abi family protein [Streptococcus suis]
MKPKLSFEDLIDRLTNEKGITLGTFSKEQVEEYLKIRSYYYKISSYRKNYPKLPDGKYDNLTFNHLEATAKVDVRLREYLLHLCLDVEHATRTNLMTQLTEDEKEDGYKIIEDFQDEFPDKFDEILGRFRNNKYKQDMFEKRTQISAWVFMEIIDYGTLVQFLEFYIHSRSVTAKNLYSAQHRYIKNIRNSCAHNDVFLINLFDKKYGVPQPNPATKSFAHSMGINNGLVRYLKIIDIINLFYVHANICSNELNIRRYQEGLAIIQKFDEQKELLHHSTYLNKFFNNIFNKCVDFLNK